jgi:hypothetical protein
MKFTKDPIPKIPKPSTSSLPSSMDIKTLPSVGGNLANAGKKNVPSKFRYKGAGEK